ncbi:MAG TPA: Xaa-Pro peptidase family protein [Actinomycetota bacterium]
MKPRRDAVRAQLDRLGVEGVLVTKPVNVRYLTGFSGSNGQLLVGDADAFLTDPRYEEQSARECPDVERMIYSTSAKTIGEAAGMHAALGTLVERLGIQRLGVEAGHMTLAAAHAIREKLPVLTLVETNEVVETLRRVKDEGEISSIGRACAYADQALGELLGALRDGMTEVECAAVLEDAMRRSGSEGASFPTIVAFGEQAAEPHHQPGRRALRAGDLIKLDFGAICDGYCSDMTRTIAFGTPSEEMTEVYRLVAGAQQAGVEAVRAGVTCGDVDAAARGYLREKGYEFGHGTGHGLGLEVHEAPPVRAGAQQVLEPGMVITVEPGIYLPGIGGVRIEDSVVVREGGCDILTGSTKELVTV